MDNPIDSFAEEAEALDRVFHQEEWPLVIRLEEEKLKVWEKRIIEMRPLETLEKYNWELAYLKGKRDGLFEIWRDRDDRLKKLKEMIEEKENQFKQGEDL